MPFSLHEFTIAVPSCVQTMTIAKVLEIFTQKQCTSVVVVDEEQRPLGVMELVQLIPLFANARGSNVKRRSQCVGESNLIKPLVTVTAVTLAELELAVREPSYRISSNWALVDSAGKYIALVDSQRLGDLARNYTPASFSGVSAPQPELDLLLQILEQLPWALMLQTSSGEVVMQNSAWNKDFHELSDPERVGREVATILHSHNPALLDEHDHTANNCQLSEQGNCICVWSLPNSHERVWEFTKIPLPGIEVVAEQNPESRIQNPELRICLQGSGEQNLKAAKHTQTRQLWLLVANDVTEQQQLASELAAKNADLIQLNRLKDEFLACISHELKTPLTAVLGLSTLLKDQALGELNARQSRYAQLIHQSGRHLMSVVNDILDLTRIETGQLKLTLESVKIAQICDRALKQVRAIQLKSTPATTAGAQSQLEHRFSCYIEPGLETLVADDLRLRQMLVQLLSNAFKFTEEGGEIGLRVNRWDGWIAFTVWDTGIGIPEAKQHLIFQKFQQLENPLTRRFEGTGLGLVLTRALARLHGGDVSFISKEGQGSSFTLLLPPNPPQKLGGEDDLVATNHWQHYPEVPTRQHSTPDYHPRLVLVVEAVPRFIANLSEKLTGLGYRVVVARSGIEALEKARRLQPKAIFINPMLPLLSGWDVLTLLKSDATTRQIPVIITATHAEKERAISNRADVLSLPVESETLSQILARFFVDPVTVSKERNDDTTTGNPITILRLMPHAEVGGTEDWLLNSALVQNYYQVIEAEDLAQAELLARLWQPQVVLLQVNSDAEAYLQQLSKYSTLAKLPIVTLAATQVATFPGLSVFPCLTPIASLSAEAVLPVLRLAAGIEWMSILVVDVTLLPDLTQAAELGHNATASSECQALNQYLQTAGFKSTIGHSWAEVWQQLEHVDLLLLYLSNTQIDARVSAALEALAQQQIPPIFVLDRRDSQAATTTNQTPKTPVTKPTEMLAAIATEILPPSLSMAALLNKIYYILKNRGQRLEVRS